MFAFRYLPEFPRELNRMRNQLDELFTGVRPALDPQAFPALNAWEDEAAYHVECELPGLTQDSIEIEMPDSATLTIRGKRKEPAVGDQKWHRRERACGSFERTLALPGAVDGEHVEATFQLGVLTVKLPKAAALLPRKIAVTAS